ncbi:uncharacterized protein LOC62_03G003585 [Vanrija pseudolonga]|uniref:Phosphogluconate dehydrogenase NAD-binding putative C-terminal domain-containing protein n=1 Tax=Vanrija pseudolonga TaxID=143232 RepID=A0AAF0Y4D1_9TREE|nr:hypothetical protein LOC62_03G003585 [Vanrija pseudolonga]
MPAIAFLYPGAMGASLASVLHRTQPSYRLLTSIASRSRVTTERSDASGLVNLPLPDVATQADIIISILPPAAALDLAHIIRALLDENPRSTPPVYVDANAVNPATMAEMAAVLGDVPLIDGAIIGFPAKDDYLPKLYLSAAPEWAADLEHVARTLSGGAPGKGLDVRVMQDGGAGAASALKMSYSGLAKGYIGLGAILAIAANAHSPGTARAFMEEMAESQPDRLWNLGGTIHHMIPNAYRMDQVSEFISTALDLPADGEPSPATVYTGLASVFERVAADLRSTGRAVGSASHGPQGDADEVEALLSWVKDSRRLLEDKGYQSNGNGN